MSRQLITLTTDFGLQDEYVGVMKGVILSRAPEVNIIDITHSIPNQDIKNAAYLVYSSAPFFPDKTIHVVIVDPGVGSNRRIVLVSALNQLFLTPDNGILTLLLNKGLCSKAYEVTCRDLFLKPTSNTFHGRDIFSPVAGELSQGLSPQEVGPSINLDSLKTIPLPNLTINNQEKKITGVVVSIDRFGNLLTNIELNEINSLFKKNQEITKIIAGNHIISRIAASYSSVPEKTLLAIFGSRGYLEISLSMGNAHVETGINLNDTIEVFFN